MPKHQAVVVGQQSQAGQRGADDPAQVELGRRQRDGGEQVLGGDEVGHHGLEGREPDRSRSPATEGQDHQHHRRIVAGGSQHGQHGGEDHLAEGGGDQPPPPVEPVGECPTQGGEQADGDEGCGGHQAGPSRLVGPGEDEHAEGHRLHPRADVRNQGCRPDEREIARPEGAQRGQGHRVRLPADWAGPTWGQGQQQARLPLVLVLASRPEGEPPDARHGGQHAEGGRWLGDLARTVGHGPDVTCPAHAPRPGRRRPDRPSGPGPYLVASSFGPDANAPGSAPAGRATSTSTPSVGTTRSSHDGIHQLARTQQFHDGRDQHHPHQGGIDQDGGGQPEPEDLEHVERVTDDERTEHADHDGSRRGDHPGRLGQAVSHRRVELSRLSAATPLACGTGGRPRSPWRDRTGW